VSAAALVLILIVATLAYQINLRARIELFGGSPDLNIILLVFLSLSYGRGVGLSFGFLGGLFLDALAPHFLGATALLGSATGYLLGSLKAKLLIENPWVRAGISVAIFCLWELFLILFYSSSSPGSFGNYLRGQFFPCAVYTYLVALLFFWIFQKRGEASS
jgi:rod shape-determining protein MreD